MPDDSADRCVRCGAPMVRARPITIQIAGEDGPLEVQIEMGLLCSVDPNHPKPMGS